MTKALLIIDVQTVFVTSLEGNVVEISTSSPKIGKVEEVLKGKS